MSDGWPETTLKPSWGSIMKSCSRCGSSKMIEDGVVFDDGRNSKSLLEAGFLRTPSRIVFRGNVSQVVRAVICGECGYLEMHLDNAPDLYAQYIEARSQLKA